MLSLDCLLSGSAEDVVPLPFQRAIVIEILPIFVMFVIVSFWMSRATCCTSAGKHLQHTQVPEEVHDLHTEHLERRRQTVLLAEQIKSLHKQVHGDEVVVQDFESPVQHDCGYLVRWAIRKAQRNKIDIRASFDFFMDETGEMSTAQFEHMLDEWGAKIEHSTFLKVVNHVDADHSGKISLAEISDYIRSTWDHTALSVTVIAFLFYPTVTKAAFAILSCRTDLEHGEHTAYLVEDPSVPCFDGRHITIIILVVLPGLALYVIGVPLGMLIILWRNRKNLHSDRFRFRYGMLISGYDDSYFWWEAVIAWRKSLIIMTSVVGRALGVSVQIYLGIGVLMGFLCVQMSKKPYSQHLLNDMENYGLLASFITLYAGLGFSSEFAMDIRKCNTEVNCSDEDLAHNDRAQVMRIFLSMFILIVNIVYFTFMVWEILVHKDLKSRGVARKVVMAVLPWRRRCCPHHHHKQHFAAVSKALHSVISAAHARNAAVHPVAPKETVRRPDEKSAGEEWDHWDRTNTNRSSSFREE